MNWSRFQENYFPVHELGFALDISHVDVPADFWPSMENSMQNAFASMAKLEKGAIANPDENRMVGHYWLRHAALAPTPELTQAIESTLASIKAFAAEVHSGSISGAAGPFKNLLCIGIGGSALGPQFVQQALGQPGSDPLNVCFFDNTDPDGIERTLQALDGKLGQTLAIVTSKSGGTPETRNGMVEAEHAWQAAGLKFGEHAVAITGEGSKLDQHAEAKGWLKRFPMWDWVGGRTSELATVGLVPAALSGFDIDAMLAGAREMDAVTRQPVTKENPAALLALMWYHATGGKGAKDMVILPYKDRLELFSRYLQQLVMESLGKEHDLDGNVVNQGIAVYGNKGSTDQHAYVQQLRDGVPNFFITFIEVLKDRNGQAVAVEDSFTSGDFLKGFLLGTRQALYEKGRQSITITVEKVDAHSVGMLIALYERAVGFYGSLVNINAYHQPGVEAGKKAAAAHLASLGAVHRCLREQPGAALTADQVADAIGVPDDTAIVFKLLEHLACNPQKQIQRSIGRTIAQNTYTYST